ncbi:unnamed protein product [Brassicogethes aeneus]|uniref:Non-structural maintenance of chromosomes element 4 n=1 Tax=Brassicogethes aeneus TaxID=1431903 RepID=A0A9P0FGB5_BRAAE|nr:unnamed protein product [Brassicogethes aeneus]
MNSSIDQENDTMSSQQSRQRITTYRTLLTKVEEIEEENELGVKTVNEVGNIIRQLNALDSQLEIKDRVQYSEEIFLDCMVLSSASTILKKCVENVDVFTSTYEPTEFTEKLNEEISNENEEVQPLDILKLLKYARDVIPEVPKINNVFGTYEFNKAPVVKQKKERVKVQKEPLVRKQPEKLTNVDREEKNIEQIVNLLYNVLKEEFINNKQEPIKYYDYVIDTQSFSDTVENMFYCSFLIRNGKAQLDLDKHGNPLIKPIGKSAAKEYRQNGGANSQVITTISIEEWKKFNKAGFLQKNKKK